MRFMDWNWNVTYWKHLWSSCQMSWFSYRYGYRKGRFLAAIIIVVGALPPALLLFPVLPSCFFCESMNPWNQADVSYCSFPYRIGLIASFLLLVFGNAVVISSQWVDLEIGANFKWKLELKIEMKKKMKKENVIVNLKCYWKIRTSGSQFQWRSIFKYS